VDSDPASRRCVTRPLRGGRAVAGVRSRLRAAHALLVACLALVPSWPVGAEASTGGVCGPRVLVAPNDDSPRCALIRRGVEANWDGRWTEAEAVWRELRALDPTDPAAPLGEVETAFWRLLHDDGATANDAIVRRAAAEAIALADRRLAADHDDPVALAQKGQALVHLARLDGIRGHYLKAGRQGERGRELLERALALRPDLEDARFLFGLYRYYASVMPGFLKWMSWLPFVPRGDASDGLRALEQVAAGDGLHGEDARFILMNIRTYHAPTDFRFAIETGRALHARHPDNALFHSELVEALLLAGLYDEAIATARELEESRPSEPEAQARPQLARILRAQGVLLDGRADEAWEILEPLDDRTARLPVWGGAWLHLVRGQVHDARGEREQALAEYRVVTGLEGGRYNRRAALIAEQALVTPFEPSAYRELPMISAGPD
jgi:tetratricopeptide (TPR) repeat protein